MQPAFSSRSASKGSSNVDMPRPLVTPAQRRPVSFLLPLHGKPDAARLLAPGDNKTCRFYAALPVTPAAVGRPSSIGSEGSRDHSFQEPKYMHTSLTPAFFRARKVFAA